MCKVVAFTNVKKVKSIRELVDVVSPLITAKDRDGFGWAALGANGVFGERSISTEHEYRLHQLKLNVTEVPVKLVYENFGRYSKLTGGSIFHGRTSTNDVNLTNTHPIQRDGWTLVHNGVVTHHGEKYKKLTSNDTEDIVYNIANHGIEGVVRNLTGYYAFAAFDPDGNLHICRDRTASLHIARIKSIDSLIVATTRSLIDDICVDMDWDRGPIDELQEDTYVVFNTSGAVIHRESIVSRGYGTREANLASKSLGRELISNARLDDDGPTLVDATEANFDLSLDAFLYEARYVDGSYDIYDESGRPIDATTFKKLDDVSKTRCHVIRPDGTIMDPYDYYTERLSGRVSNG